MRIYGVMVEIIVLMYPDDSFVRRPCLQVLLTIKLIRRGSKAGDRPGGDSTVEQAGLMPREAAVARRRGAEPLLWAEQSAETADTWGGRGGLTARSHVGSME